MTGKGEGREWNIASRSGEAVSIVTRGKGEHSFRNIMTEKKKTHTQVGKIQLTLFNISNRKHDNKKNHLQLLMVFMQFVVNVQRSPMNVFFYCKYTSLISLGFD